MSADKVIPYLERLTGKALTPSTPFGLSSSKKAQLAAWLRREGVEFDYSDIDRPSTTVSQILGGGGAGPGAAAEAAPRVLAEANGPIALALPTLRIGIDIESIDNLPGAADVRSHPFYQENYSPQELARCLERPDTELSLCGLWAAKEAIVKAGGAAPPKKGRLGHIEIQHDENGAPHFANTTLSITHEGKLAVAVCIYFGGGTQ